MFILDHVLDCQFARAAKLRLTKNGGRGAVREFAELLLRARGEWDELVERYVKSRSEEHA